MGTSPALLDPPRPPHTLHVLGHSEENVPTAATSSSVLTSDCSWRTAGVSVPDASADSRNDPFCFLPSPSSPLFLLHWGVGAGQSSADRTEHLWGH